ADDVIQEGLALAPDSEAVWLARGGIHGRRGDLQEAIFSYERAESFAPESEAAPLQLAALLRANGAAARADAVLQRLLRRTRGSTPGALRARLALAIARGDGVSAGRSAEALM